MYSCHKVFPPILCRFQADLKAPAEEQLSLYIQGRHVSGKMYFQGDDSELKECGRGCKQHDPSGSAPPHVIAHYSGRSSDQARPYYNRQGDEMHSQAVGRARRCSMWRPSANMQALHICMEPAVDCTLIYSPLLFKHTQK